MFLFLFLDNIVDTPHDTVFLHLSTLKIAWKVNRCYIFSDSNHNISAMEKIIQKKKDTIGPFPSPITRKIGIHNLGFETYNEYEHGSDVNCCTWDITETGQTAT